ncbi:MAG: hypothetical protein IJZ16_13360 [Clostridia bacterium]|nr:hypothetical protein [Clostridia bacterium]
MNFNEFDWADSILEKIIIEYDKAILIIVNNSLQQKLYVECTGLVGITNLCIWDDTIIMNAEIKSIVDNNTEFIRNLYLAYDHNFDYGGRSLNEGVLDLCVELSNYITFNVFCLKVAVRNQSGDGSSVF